MRLSLEQAAQQGDPGHAGGKQEGEQGGQHALQNQSGSQRQSVRLQMGDDVQHQRVDPVHTKDHLGAQAQGLLGRAQRLGMAGKEGAHPHEQGGGNEIVGEGVAAFKGEIALFRAGVEQIPHQMHGVSCHAAQIDQKPGPAAQLLPPQQPAQQDIPHQSLQHRAEQHNLEGEDLIEGWTEGGGEQNDAKQKQNLPGGAGLDQPPQEGADQVDAKEHVDVPHVVLHALAQKKLQKDRQAEGLGAGEDGHGEVDPIPNHQRDQQLRQLLFVKGRDLSRAVIVQHQAAADHQK